MNNDFGYDNNSGRFLFFLFTLTGVAIFFYSSTLSALFLAVIHREGSSHGIFVPFLTSYLIWLRWDRIKCLAVRGNLVQGTIALTIGGFFFFLGEYSEYQLCFKTLSFLSVGGGLVLLFFGKQIFIETAFPLFFLATMIPIPQEIYSAIADRMRLLSTLGSVTLTKALGVPLHREEFMIFLPETSLMVAKSCSGIRYLLSYFAFSLVYAILFKHGTLARFGVILCSIPLAILASIFRLTVIFLAAHYISPRMAEHLPHVILSWAVFAAILFGIIAFDQILALRSKTRQHHPSKDGFYE